MPEEVIGGTPLCVIVTVWGLRDGTWAGDVIVESPWYRRGWGCSQQSPQYVAERIAEWGQFLERSFKGGTTVKFPCEGGWDLSVRQGCMRGFILGGGEISEGTL